MSPPATPLCDIDKPIVLERMEFPEPVISVAVEPKSKPDQEKWVSPWANWPRKTLIPRQDGRGNRANDYLGHG